MVNRRQIVKLGAAGWVLSQAPAVALAKTTSNASSLPTPKLVWVVLRGAMDSLHAVIPSSDPHLMQHRAALVNAVSDTALPLNKHFSLHPELKTLHKWYQQKQMAPVVAVASSYRARSHFDAQDQLESGLTTTDHNDGWLARAFEQYQNKLEQNQSEAIAIARSVPLSLRGVSRSASNTATVKTLYPSVLPDADADLYERLEYLYRDKPELQARLQAGLNARDMLSDESKKSKQPKFPQLAKMCGELLAQREYASCAMLEMGGWDTHNAQASRLNRQFKALDTGLAALKTGLGEAWDNTLVVIATEFGRTVAMNGTGGTDHGTGSALLLAGGKLNGGSVLGQWPGLAPEQLYQGRDLQPTSDIRNWLAALLQQHWQLNAGDIAKVFPELEVDTPILKQKLIA